MSITRKKIAEANHDLNGLTKVAEGLGYETTDDFFSDNPGAVEAIYEWLLYDSPSLMRDGTKIPDGDGDWDEEQDEEEDEEIG